MEPEYWPDLTLLPEGWRIAHIAWESGRALVMLERNRDEAEAYSTANHRTPAGAFADAVAKAEAM